MNKENGKRIIVVLGMHRSGTSAIARSLQLLGVELGSSLLSANPDNIKGFWEDAEINAFNAELLQSVGADWHSLAPVTTEKLLNILNTGFFGRALELLREKTKQISIFGIKDPRMSRLLLFWQRVFEQGDYNVSYVIALRNPLSVAQSLRNRDGFEPEKSFYLWLEHVVPAIVGTKDFKRVVVDYDRLLDDPGLELACVANALGLSEPDPSALAAYKNEFLEEGLRHTRYETRDLRLDASVPAPVISAYELLEQLANDKIALDSPQVEDVFDDLSKELSRLAPALHYLTRQEQKIGAPYQQQIASLNQELLQIQKSQSWKITRPLRYISSLIKRNFHKR